VRCLSHFPHNADWCCQPLPCPFPFPQTKCVHPSRLPLRSSCKCSPVRVTVLSVRCGVPIPRYSMYTVSTGAIVSRSDEERIRFIEHKGKRILLLDFSLATASQMLPLLTQVRTAVAQHGPKSLVILADYQGAEIDHKVAIKIKEVIALDRPFVKKAAWVGTEHIPHALIESVHIFAQRETTTFKTREEALEWLVRE
jgi:hypothetical protein